MEQADLDLLRVVEALLRKGLPADQVAREVGVSTRWIEWVSQADGFQTLRNGG